MSCYRHERPDLRVLSASLRYLPQEVTDLRRASDRSSRLRRTSIAFRQVAGFDTPKGVVWMDLPAPADLPAPVRRSIQ